MDTIKGEIDFCTELTGLRTYKNEDLKQGYNTGRQNNELHSRAKIAL